MFKIGITSVDVKIWSVSTTITTSTATTTSSKTLPLSKPIQNIRYYDRSFHSGIYSGVHCFNCLPFPGFPVLCRPLQGVASTYILVLVDMHFVCLLAHGFSTSTLMRLVALKPLFHSFNISSLTSFVFFFFEFEQMMD